MAKLSVACLLAGFALSSGAYAVPSATVITGFDGVSLRDYNAAIFNPATGRGGLLIPPDNALGVSADHVVNWTNGGIAIYTRDGTRLSYRTNTQFLVDAGIAQAEIPANPFDIRLTYDFDSQRYIGIAENAGNANPIYIVRSNNSDPTQGFKAVRFNTGSPVDFGDFPTLGIDGEAITISVNNFDAVGFTGLGVYSVPKEDIIADTPTLARLYREEGFGGVPDFGQGFALQFVNTFGQNDGSQRVFATSNDFFDELETGTLTFNPDNTVQDLVFSPSLNIQFDGNPRDQDQPVPVGPPLLDGADRRISNDVWQVGDYVYIVSTVRERLDPDPERRNQIRLLIIEESTNTIVEERLIGIDGVDVSYPSIAVNETGTNFVISYSGSGETQPLTTYATACEFNLGSVVQCGAPLTLRVSDDPGYFLTFGGARNRSGDYSDAQYDPADPLSFWVVSMYAQAKDPNEPRGPDFDDRWGTWVAQIRLDQVAVPAPGGVAALAFGLLGLAGLRRR